MDSPSDSRNSDDARLGKDSELSGTLESGIKPPVSQCFGTKTKVIDGKEMFFELEN